ncbi:MAG: FtsW/RodA/SpoVE family cell cycle protein [Deltaproteobacteria bacterium]|nr:FtsW/RodA/SpoVE family cell cycle protein [Deltaproteobacteria bacterium]
MKALPDGFDVQLLIISVFVLTLIGILEVWSSSFVYSLSHMHTSYFFINKQIGFVILGIVFTYLFYRVDYNILRRGSYFLLLISFLFLILLHFGFGVCIRGACRWLNVGGFSFQPSELARFSIVLYAAHFLAKKGSKITNFKEGFLPLYIVTYLLSLLVVIEPDLGFALLLMVCVTTVMYVAGARIIHIVLGFFPMLMGIFVIILVYPSKFHRLIQFFQHTTVFQVQQSLIALGSGGLFGKWAQGGGHYKNLFLPDAYNDFILSGVGEDFGFLGIFVVSLAIFCLIFSIFRIAWRVKDDFAHYLCLGIGISLAYQSMINMGTAVNLLPSKGITLPFVSYGGSSLLINFIILGILLSIVSRNA